MSPFRYTDYQGGIIEVDEENRDVADALARMEADARNKEHLDSVNALGDKRIVSINNTIRAAVSDAYEAHNERIRSKASPTTNIPYDAGLDGLIISSNSYGNNNTQNTSTTLETEEYDYVTWTGKLAIIILFIILLIVCGLGASLVDSILKCGSVLC